MKYGERFYGLHKKLNIVKKKYILKELALRAMNRYKHKNEEAHVPTFSLASFGQLSLIRDPQIYFTNPEKGSVIPTEHKYDIRLHFPRGTLLFIYFVCTIDVYIPKFFEKRLHL